MLTSVELCEYWVELVDREGNLVGRGASNVDLPGGTGDDGTFHVCVVGG